ncbi:MAG: TolC family protein, partial [Candidatus Hydrogenedentes bacterium]|nr:TolC family protein [Candidatus Hydrogenedentota bacterium]
MKRVRRLMPRTGAVAVAFMAASCMTGPNYHRPALDTPPAYKSATPSENAQPELGGDWWRLFDDPELSALEEEALRANQNLKAAMARVAQARAAAAGVRSSFFPVITLDPSATRSRIPTPSVTQTTNGLSEVSTVLQQISGIARQVQNFGQGTGTGTGGSSTLSSGGLASTTGATSSGTLANSFRVPFDLSYEIDIWGRLRRSYESSRALFLASAYDFEVVCQTLLADVARNYFNLRGFDAKYQ